ncbi:MAG TPA: zf-HC2 domain-containing protein [Thermoleophilia bacterium]|nr:zf-HC2 domain-containing protein [Thermoleophilia bacterium]
MDCAAVREHLDVYLAGEAADEVSEQLSAHLQTCDACLARARELGALVGRLRALPEQLSPPRRLVVVAPAPARPRRALLALAAALTAWGLFSAALLFSSTFAQRFSFLPLAGSQAPQAGLGGRAPLPMAALVELQELLGGRRSETASGVSRELTDALAQGERGKARSYELSSIERVSALPGGRLRLQLEMAVRYAGSTTPVAVPLSVELRQRRGGWIVTQVGTP